MFKKPTLNLPTSQNVQGITYKITFPLRTGVAVTDRPTQITALTPTSQLTVYQSRLTVNVDASAGPTYW